MFMNNNQNHIWCCSDWPCICKSNNKDNSKNYNSGIFLNSEKLNTYEWMSGIRTVYQAISIVDVCFKNTTLKEMFWQNEYGIHFRKKMVKTRLFWLWNKLKSCC